MIYYSPLTPRGVDEQGQDKQGKDNEHEHEHDVEFTNPTLLNTILNEMFEAEITETSHKRDPLSVFLCKYMLTFVHAPNKC